MPGCAAGAWHSPLPTRANPADQPLPRQASQNPADSRCERRAGLALNTTPSTAQAARPANPAWHTTRTKENPPTHAVSVVPALEGTSLRPGWLGPQLF